MIDVVHGDITDQDDVDVIVNAANAELKPGGGVAGAIHDKAGFSLWEECKSLAPITVGQAVMTDAYGLLNEKVIHVLGPRYGQDRPEDDLLSDAYRNALMIADEHKYRSIAFPAISTGSFGFPFDKAVKIALETVEETMKIVDFVQTVRFVLYTEDDYNRFKHIEESM